MLASGNKSIVMNTNETVITLLGIGQKGLVAEDGGKAYNYGNIELNGYSQIGMEANGKDTEAYNYGIIQLGGKEVSGDKLGEFTDTFIGKDSNDNRGMVASHGGKIVNKGKITFTTK